jgi:hypothetical protein
LLSCAPGTTVVDVPIHAWERELPDEPSPDPLQAVSNLADALDTAVPAKKLHRKPIVSTSTLRQLGHVTQRWVAQDDDQPKRSVGDGRRIAEIMARFNVLAVPRSHR